MVLFPTVLCQQQVVFPPSLLVFAPGGHPVLDLCGMVRRTRRIRVAKAGLTSRPASGAPVALSTTAADALRVVANPARKPRRPRQEVTHLQRKHPLPRPSRVGLSRKEPAHRHLPSFTIVRVSLAAEAKHWAARTDVWHGIKLRWRSLYCIIVPRGFAWWIPSCIRGMEIDIFFLSLRYSFFVNNKEETSNKIWAIKIWLDDRHKLAPCIRPDYHQLPAESMQTCFFSIIFMWQLQKRFGETANVFLNLS